MKPTSPALALAASLSFAACGSSHDDYRGLDDRATFAATQSRGCTALQLFSSRPSGCPLTRPFATGVHESVTVTLDDDAVTSIVLRARNPSVLTVDSPRLTSNNRDATFSASITAMQPGVTELVVETMSGVPIDRVRVEVADAVRIQLQADTDVSDPGRLSADQRTFTLRNGRRASITAQGIDARGRMLLGNDAVRWTVPDTSVVSLSWLFESGASIDDDRVYVTGRALGAATLTATLNLATATVQAVVTP